jgi:heme/copper-type cytochrome/quinol oxidase subunit 4
MFSRRISFRTLIVSFILGMALALIPLATALAGGAGTTYP